MTQIGADSEVEVRFRRPPGPMSLSSPPGPRPLPPFLGHPGASHDFSLQIILASGPQNRRRTVILAFQSLNTAMVGR